MEIKIYTFYTDYADSYDFFIKGDFGIENSLLQALHIWKTDKGGPNKWRIQFAVVDSPYKAIDKYQETVKEVKAMKGIPQEIYSHIFNLIFRMDDYEEFREYRLSNNITINHTDMSKE